MHTESQLIAKPVKETVEPSFASMNDNRKIEDAETHLERLTTDELLRFKSINSPDLWIVVHQSGSAGPILEGGLPCGLVVDGLANVSLGVVQITIGRLLWEKGNVSLEWMMHYSVSDQYNHVDPSGRR